MNIRVQLFAVARQLAKQDEISIELPAGATVADLRVQIAEMFPILADMLPMTAIAVNAEYADDKTPVPVNGTVVVIPPVSGG